MNVYRVDGVDRRDHGGRERSEPAERAVLSRPTNRSSTWSNRGSAPRNIYAYDVTGGGKRLTRKRKFLDAGPGTPDGMRCDVDGNIWFGWGMGTRSSMASSSTTRMAA